MKLTLKYGLIIGLGTALWVLLEFAFGFHTTRLEYGQVSGYLSGIIPAVALLFAFRDLKRSQNGELRMWDAVKTGFFISAIASFFIAVFFWVYYAFINPGFYELIRQGVESQVASTAADADQLSSQLGLVELLYGHPMLEVLMFFGTLAEGVFMSLLIGVFLRSKKAGS